MTSNPKIEFTLIAPKADPDAGVPCERSSHGLSLMAAAANDDDDGDGGDTLVLYGGEHVARTPLPDDQALWLCVRSTTTGSKEWQWKSIKNCRVVPPARVAHTQTAVGKEDVYIFGGRAGITMSEKPMNDMWKFSINTNEWSEVVPKNDAPSPRSFHKMVSVGTDIYIFGGCSAEGRLADLWKFDTVSKQWTPLGKSQLRGRGGANLIVLNGGKTLGVIAGFAGEETNDGHRFNVEQGKWEDDLIKKEDLETMRPRSVCVSGVVSGKAIVFGGEVDPSQKGHEGAGGFENDVVVLDGTSGEYITRIGAPAAAGGAWPETRGWSDGACSGSSMFVFGGLSGDDTNPRRLNDLWSLSVTE